jgi:hypothetical protein
MTDQPTKVPRARKYDITPWALNDSEWCSFMHLPNNGFVRFEGDNHKANAALFLRAQHMDELVAWADEFVALEEEALGDWANDTLTPPTGNEPFMVRLKSLKAILAKYREGEMTIEQNREQAIEAARQAYERKMGYSFLERFRAAIDAYEKAMKEAGRTEISKMVEYASRNWNQLIPLPQPPEVK